MTNTQDKVWNGTECRDDIISGLSQYALLEQPAATSREELGDVLRRVHARLGGSSALADPLGRQEKLLPSLATPDSAGSVDKRWLGMVGSLAREALEATTTRSYRRQYGQFFTETAISALACAFAIHPSTGSVIDPMCGTGDMLWEAVERCRYLGIARDSAFVGVEIDPIAALVACLPPSALGADVMSAMTVYHDDAFLLLSELLSNQRTAHHLRRYDAVVGNPPYIRYQNVASLVRNGSEQAVDLFRSAMPGDPESALADMMIRACLISDLLPDGSPQDRVDQAVALLCGSQSASAGLDPLDIAWIKLVASYSGLADLSVPAWLLTWQLARPGATIAYVTTASWRSREYARLLRYFMLRMLKPLFIIEQEGGWFDNAQVSTSLIVLKARSRDEATIPLQSRERTDAAVRMVHLRRRSNLAELDTLRHIAVGLGASPAGESHCGTARQADVIACAIAKQDSGADTDYWKIRLVEEQSLIDQLLVEDAAAQRSGASGVSLQDIEAFGTANRRVYPAPVMREKDHQAVVVPRIIREALGTEGISPESLRLPVDLGIDVNQGLRTGCNPFFYVRQLAPVHPLQSTSEVLEIDLAAATRILSSPATHKEELSALMSRLRRARALVPETLSGIGASSRLVLLDDEFGGRLAVVPEGCLRRAVRYQRTMRGPAIESQDHLPYRALVTGGGAVPRDYDEAVERYPCYWVEVWKQRDGFSKLSSPLEEYIQLAERLQLERNGKLKRIPELSAVAPNSRRPAVPLSRPLIHDEKLVPKAPTWWYSLPVRSRHTGHVFVPRVNSELISAFLNDLSDPVLVDANFSTLSVHGAQFPAQALFAFLNSVWTQAILEASATPMGGGALKVEAAHLRVLPIPRLGEGVVDRLAERGRQLARARDESEIREVLRRINSLVCENVSASLGLDPGEVFRSLEETSQKLRDRRRR